MVALPCATGIYELIRDSLRFLQLNHTRVIGYGLGWFLHKISLYIVYARRPQHGQAVSILHAHGYAFYVKGLYCPVDTTQLILLFLALAEAVSQRLIKLYVVDRHMF